MKSMMDRSRSLKMDEHKLQGKVASALSLAGLRYGGAEQVTEAIARFGLTHGMIVVGGVGDPLSSGHFGIASLQADEGWRRAEGDAIAVANAKGVGRRVAEVAQALKS
jgi:multimeric flavodoxin WrbA